MIGPTKPRLSWLVALTFLASTCAFAGPFSKVDVRLRKFDQLGEAIDEAMRSVSGPFELEVRTIDVTKPAEPHPRRVAVDLPETVESDLEVLKQGIDRFTEIGKAREWSIAQTANAVCSAWYSRRFRADGKLRSKQVEPLRVDGNVTPEQARQFLPPLQIADVLVLAKTEEYVIIDSIPEGASIAISGYAGWSQTIEDGYLPAGTYTLKLLKSGYSELNTTINVKRRPRNSFTFTLVSEDVIKRAINDVTSGDSGKAHDAWTVIDAARDATDAPVASLVTIACDLNIAHDRREHASKWLSALPQPKRLAAAVQLAPELDEQNSKEHRDNAKTVARTVWPKAEDVVGLIEGWTKEGDPSADHETEIECFVLSDIAAQKGTEVWKRALKTSGDSHLRARITRLLGRAGAVDPNSVECIAWALANDEFNSVRLEAARSLKRLGHRAKNAVPELVQALVDRDNEISATVSDALVEVGSEAVSVLKTAASSKDDRLRERAEAVLRRLEANQKTSDKH
jgi:HEAT repeats/PEGA domain